MADATFNDILKQQKITNSLLEQEAMDEGKPNPKKFIKEEALSILLERKYAKSSLGLAKKGNKIADANEKVNTKSGQRDRKIYQEQLEKQGILVDEGGDTVEALDVGLNEGQKLLVASEAGHDGTQNAILENARIVENAIVGLKFQNIKAANDDKLERQKERVQSNLDGRRNVTDVIRKTRDALLPTLNRIGSVLMEGPRALGRGVRKQAGNALDFLKNIFGKILGAGLLVGMVTFFSSQAFKRIVEWFQGDGLEIIANFYDKVFEPAIVKGFAMLVDIFTAIGNYFSKPEFKEAFRLIKEGKIFDALELALTTLTDDLGKQFGIENLSKKIGTALGMFYNGIANTLNGIISVLNFGGAGIDFKLPKYNPETGKFEEVPSGVGVRPKGTATTMRKESRRPGGGLTPEQQKEADERAERVSNFFRGFTGQRTVEQQEQLKNLLDPFRGGGRKSANAKIRKEIVKNFDAANEAAAKIASAQEKQRELLEFQENTGKDVKITGARNRQRIVVIAEEIDRLNAEIAAATAAQKAATTQLNNFQNTSNVNSSPVTVAGSGGGNMGPGSEVTAALSRSMGFGIYY